MGEAARRPDLREQVGIAVNASKLVTTSGKKRAGGMESPETHLDRVGALGMATLAVQLGAARAGVPVAAMRGVIPKAEDVLAGELSALLWHIRYGGQHDFIPRAIRYFSEWITHRPRFANFERRHLEALAVRAMHEWLSDRCQACGGSGKLERSRTGSWIRPRGSMQRNATFRVCPACDGSRLAPIRHPERMKLLGLTREEYEAGRWPQHFKAALVWLGKMVAPMVQRPLTRELERRTKRV
jgi:hypothetical protein